MIRALLLWIGMAAGATGFASFSFSAVQMFAVDPPSSRAALISASDAARTGDGARAQALRGACEAREIRAWVNRMPGGPAQLIVTGEVALPQDVGGPLQVDAEIAGDPATLTLSVGGSGPGDGGAWLALRYETPATVRFANVRIMCGGREAASVNRIAVVS